MCVQMRVIVRIELGPVNLLNPNDCTNQSSLRKDFEQIK